MTGNKDRKKERQKDKERQRESSDRLMTIFVS